MGFDTATPKLCEEESSAVGHGQTVLQRRCDGCEGRERGMGLVLQRYSPIRRDLQMRKFGGLVYQHVGLEGNDRDAFTILLYSA